MWFINHFQLFVINSIAIFAILTGFIISREYQHKTINNLLTYPYSRLHFLTGKTIVVIGMIILTCLIAFSVNTIAGSIFIDEKLTLDKIIILLRCHLVIAGIYISFVPVWLFASIVGKSYIPAILIGVVLVSLPGPIGGQKAYADIVQTVTRLAGVGEPINIWAFVSVFGIIFFNFLLLSTFIFTKRDVHSGT